jgi:hypothetical protein
LPSPVTSNGLVKPLALNGPGRHVAAYDEIAAPPSDDGGENAIEACALPRVAATFSGIPGTVADMMVPICPAKFFGELTACVAMDELTNEARFSEVVPSVGRLV